MEKAAAATLLAVGTFCWVLPLISPALGQVNVNGYYRSNGTYVQPHRRTAPDGIRSNNYSYPGNYNPNAGRSSGGVYGSNGRTQRGNAFSW